MEKVIERQMKTWKRIIMLVACVFAILGLSLRILINASLSVAIWWLLLPEPYSKLLSGIVNFGTILGICSLIIWFYSFLRNKDEIEL
jgi:hypothetical protein